MLVSMAPTGDESDRVTGVIVSRDWLRRVRSIVLWAGIGLGISLVVSHSVETFPFPNAQRRGSTQFGANDFVVVTEWRTFATSFTSFQRFVGAREWPATSPQSLAAELRRFRSTIDWTADPMVGKAALVWKPAGDGEYYLIERGFPFVAQYSAFSMPPDEKLTLEKKSRATAVGLVGHNLFVWLPQVRWLGLLANIAACGCAVWLIVTGPVAIWKQCRRRFRRRAGACGECGYSLIGQPPAGLCPECGQGGNGNR